MFFNEFEYTNTEYGSYLYFNEPEETQEEYQQRMLDSLDRDFAEMYANLFEDYTIDYVLEMNEDERNQLKQRLDFKKRCWIEDLSEDTIRENIDLVEFHIISYTQKLSERFMDEYQDKLDWCSLSKEQSMSYEFIMKFFDKINFEFLSWNTHLSYSTIKKLGDKLKHTEVIDNIISSCIAVQVMHDCIDYDIPEVISAVRRYM